jgi:uncharacterized membrane-anchored protein
VNVNALYWVTMMLAGVFGTVAGDLAAKWITEPGAAIAVFAMAAFAIAYFRHRGILLHAAAYWTVVGLIRTAGTAAGDTVAHGIGLAPSTVLTGIVFVVLAVLSSRSSATLSR